jgi:hypothetical protein
LNQLTKELQSKDKRLTELLELQNMYLEAFEQKTFPIVVLQERLQKVTNEKSQLEQKKNEISIQLSSSDSKVIQPELIQMLLEQFSAVYKKASRDRQKS